MQNIFDNETFFAAYQRLRQKEGNLNDLIVDSALGRLLPDVDGKAVLDLGCGDGRHCAEFAAHGAKRVVGMDISEKMLQVAKANHAHPAIQYLNRSMTDLLSLGESFDFIYSNMAFHYIEDFFAFAHTLYAALNPGGTLLFAQEHPVITATMDGKDHFNKTLFGKKVSFTFADYGLPGQRVTHWFVDGVVKYHRRLSDILNALTDAGFCIERVEEPLPDKEALERVPSLASQFIKPTFLIVKAKKAVSA